MTTLSDSLSTALQLLAAPTPQLMEIGSLSLALHMASASKAYTFADRSTWLNYKNRGNLEILMQGDKRMFNPYGVMLVNPERHPHFKAVEGRKFIEWTTSGEGVRHITAYGIDGQQVFFTHGSR
jgi:tungstate transport system substrate-binding protein